MIDAAASRLDHVAHLNCYLAPSSLPGAVVPPRRNPYRTAISGGVVGILGGMLLLGGLIRLWELLSDTLR